MNFETLIAFISSVALLAISPGPDNIYVMMQSMVYGKKYGIATILGLMTGCLIHTALVAFGASVVLKENPKLFFIIKLFGALYLVYLAYKVYQSDANITLNKKNVTQKSTWQLFQQGFIMNVLNPKVTLFFLALFPGFLFSKNMAKELQFSILGLLFIATSFIIFSSIALLASTIADKLKNNQKIGVYLKWLQIMVFMGIAVFIMVN